MNQAYYGNQANWLAMMEKDPASREWFNNRLAQIWEDPAQEGSFYGGGTAMAPFIAVPVQQSSQYANWWDDPQYNP